jgi:hypothetical protein
VAEHNVVKAEKLPVREHWAILIFDTYYSDDGWSEREGGGNTPHPYVRYYAYDTEAEWKAELAALFFKDPSRKDVRAMRGVQPVPLNISINVGA